jgi:hypothetical protein
MQVTEEGLIPSSSRSILTCDSVFTFSFEEELHEKEFAVL